MAEATDGGHLPVRPDYDQQGYRGGVIPVLVPPDMDHHDGENSVRTVHRQNLRMECTFAVADQAALHPLTHLVEEGICIARLTKQRLVAVDDNPEGESAVDRGTGLEVDVPYLPISGSLLQQGEGLLNS